MQAPNQLSFLPEDYLLNQQRRRTNVICAGLFVVILAAVALAFASADQMLRRTEHQHAELERRYATAANRIRQVRDVQKKQQTLARQAELTSGLLERVPRSNLLAVLTNALPGGATLTDIDLVTRRVAQPRVARPPVRPPLKAAPVPMKREVIVRINGRSEDDARVAAYLRALDASPMLKDVNLLLTQEEQRDGQAGRKFGIEATLNDAYDPAADGFGPDTFVADLAPSSFK